MRSINLIFCIILVVVPTVFSQYYYVETPRGRQVPITHDQGANLNVAECLAITDQVMEILDSTGAVCLDTASSKYNCHGFAWHIHEHPEETDSICWMSAQEYYYREDGSFNSVDSLYCTKLHYDMPAYQTHSAISVSDHPIWKYEPGYSGWVIAKWSKGPLILHDPYNVPWNLLDPNEYGYGDPDTFWAKACDVPQEDSTIGLAMSHAVPTQTITVDSTCTEIGDVTISSNNQIVFKSNAVVQMPDNKKIIIYGKITADSATFTLASGASEWGGIEIRASAPNTCRLANCLIEEADTGVSIYNNGVTIDSCQISDCTYGVYINTTGDSVTIYDSKIIDHTCAVYNYASDVEITHCDLSAYASCLNTGTSTSGPLVELCDLQGTFYGVDNLRGGDPRVGNTADTSGYNNFIIPPRSTGLYVRTTSSFPVTAENNYWGTASPDPNDFSADVDYTPLASYACAGAGTLWKTDPQTRLIADGLAAFRNKEYLRATQLLLSDDVLSSNNGSHYLFYGFKAAHKVGQLSKILQVNSQLAESDKSQIRTVYKIWEITSLAEQGNFDRALTLIKSFPIINQFGLLLDVSRIAWEMGDLPQAKNILNIARADFTDQEDFERRIWDVEHLFEMQPPHLTKNISEDRILQNTIKDFDLALAYPNPFNPSTTIMFNLSSEQFVDLAVYNMLGQKIKKLCDARLQAGLHNISWNGTNECGIPVASGVYFVGLQTQQQVQTIKVLFLK